MKLSGELLAALPGVAKGQLQRIKSRAEAAQPGFRRRPFLSSPPPAHGRERTPLAAPRGSRNSSEPGGGWVEPPGPGAAGCALLGKESQTCSLPPPPGAGSPDFRVKNAALVMHQSPRARVAENHLLFEKFNTLLLFLKKQNLHVQGQSTPEFQLPGGAGGGNVADPSWKQETGATRICLPKTKQEPLLPTQSASDM